MKTPECPQGKVVPNDLPFDGANGDHQGTLGSKDSYDIVLFFDAVGYCENLRTSLNVTAAI